MIGGNGQPAGSPPRLRPAEKGASDAASRLLWPDVVRGVAICAVVVIHCSSRSVADYARASPSWWWAGNAYDSAARLGVPLFVMVSGALLLDDRRQFSWGGFFRRRILRVVVPLVAWSIIYVGWMMKTQGYRATPLEIARQIAAGPIYSHLWFPYMILGLYLITPVRRVYAQAAPLGNQLYFVIAWFTGTIMLPMTREFLHLDIGLKLEAFSGYVGYYLLGSLLAKWLSGRNSRTITYCCLAGLALGWAATAMGTYHVTMRNGGILYERFYENLTPNVLLTATSAYVLLFALGQKVAAAGHSGRVPWRLAAGLGQISWGTYLAHRIVLEGAYWGFFGFRMVPAQWHPVLAIPSAVGVRLLGTSTIVLALRAIPWLRWLVP